MIASPDAASPVRTAVSTLLTWPPITIRYLPEQIVRAIKRSNRGRFEHLVLDLVAQSDTGKLDGADCFGLRHGWGSTVRGLMIVRRIGQAARDGLISPPVGVPPSGGFCFRFRVLPTG